LRPPLKQKYSALNDVEFERGTAQRAGRRVKYISYTPVMLTWNLRTDAVKMLEAEKQTK
jgi:hypothetical protein